MGEASHKRSAGSHRRAVVTGASTGIGAAFAERLAREQYNLVIAARDWQRLEALAARLHQKHGVEVEVVPADLTKPSDLQKLEDTVAKDRALELLVNNAGFATKGRVAELDPDREEEEIRLNIVALVRLTRAALPGMIARGQGAIINVSSLSAFQPGPYGATYAATKAFVNSFTEALHEELRGSRVRVQALCPGFTRTEFQQRAGINVSQVPAVAWMTPEAVVDASLAALQRGELICIPGLSNRLLAMLASTMPRSITRRVSGILSKRVLD